MKKVKTFTCLFLSMVSCFIIGLFASSTFKFNEPVELYRWIMISLIGLMTLIWFLIDYRKK